MQRTTGSSGTESTGAAPDVAPYVEAVLARIDGTLTEGLDASQAEWATRVYRSTVLPYHLRFTPNRSDDAERQDDVDIVARQVSASLSGLGPGERWQAILEAYYYAALQPLGEWAFDLARATYTLGAPQEDAARDAESIAARVEKLAGDMAQYAPATAENLAGDVSETLLDCAYARERANRTSLRLGREIRRLRQS